MKRELTCLTGLLAAVVLALPGCMGRKAPCHFTGDIGPYRKTALDIEYPTTCTAPDDELLLAERPRTVLDPTQAEYWDVGLQEAVHLALEHSKVMRDLGGTVIRSPETVRTSLEPAIQESDPQFGVEGALAAFDADFTTSFFFERNDRKRNNEFVGNEGLFNQDFAVWETEITKRAATGSQFTIRKTIDYDDDNSLGNLFDNGVWDVIFEGEVRHPLLQGSGARFNRIAGPGAVPGVYNGVLVARVRTDISLADFQMGLRDLVANVENAYWDLYFAYRDLDAKIQARDSALETWRNVHALYKAGRRGGEAQKEAQAREQYFRFQEEVQNALAGKILEGTRTNNGSSAGSFRGFPGVLVNERRLRLLIGLPPTGDTLLRPSDEPSTSPVAFDWSASVAEALSSRAELRRQRWQVRSRELELVAARNFLLPNLDFVGRYRFRGFGEELLNSSGNPDYDPLVTDKQNRRRRFDNAFTNLTDGDFQEYQLGLELSLPIGFRRAHAGVRNAELRLSRERAVLREQERQIGHDLSNAVADADRAFVVMQTNYNRTAAAKQQLEALQAAYEDDKAEFYEVLDAQRRYVDAESRYYEARVEYALALRNVHFEKGSLLAYCGVNLSEGPSPAKAYCDAAELECRRGRSKPINYVCNAPPIVSQGPRPPTMEIARPVSGAEPVEPAAPAEPAAPFIDEPPSEARSPQTRHVAGSRLRRGREEPLATALFGLESELEAQEGPAPGEKNSLTSVQRPSTRFREGPPAPGAFPINTLFDGGPAEPGTVEARFVEPGQTADTPSEDTETETAAAQPAPGAAEPAASAPADDRPDRRPVHQPAIHLEEPSWVDGAGEEAIQQSSYEAAGREDHLEALLDELSRRSPAPAATVPAAIPPADPDNPLRTAGEPLRAPAHAPSGPTAGPANPDDPARVQFRIDCFETPGS